MIWISSILISNDATLDDPFHVLTRLIALFRLNPVRFPLLFLLSVVIPSCGVAAYVLAKHALDLHSNGIRVVGHVLGYQGENSRLHDGSMASGVFPMIAFKDATGTEYTIRGSTARPLSRLKTGDVVEIIYLAHHPQEGILNTWYELYLVPLFFGLMTLAFLALLCLVLCRIVRP